MKKSRGLLVLNFAFLLIFFAAGGCVTKDQSREWRLSNSSRATNLRSPAGTSDTGGGDWFIEALPVFKINFPEESGYVGGVFYRRIDLRSCRTGETSMGYSDQQATTYFPGRDFSAIKVLTAHNRVICSYGIVEREPTKALQILVNNDETNRDQSFDGYLIGSKIFGGSLVTGNFLIASVNGKLRGFGTAGRQNLPLNKNFWQEFSKVSNVEKFDSIYVPQSFEPKNTVYFGNLQTGNWRLIFEVAVDPRSIPLSAFSKQLNDLRATEDTNFSDLLNLVALPKGFPGGVNEPWTTTAQIWSTLLRNSKNSELLNRFFARYDLPLKFGQEYEYEKLKVIADRFEFKFTPTVGLSQISKASYHASGKRIEFTLPLLNPSWRVAADLIHEITHATQDWQGLNTADVKFRNEMEAHLNENEFINGVRSESNTLEQAILVNRYIVATGVPLLKFVDQAIPSSKASLCNEVIEAYKIDRSAISQETLSKFRCND